MKKISLLSGLLITALFVAIPVVYACLPGTGTCTVASGCTTINATSAEADPGETGLIYSHTGVQYQYFATAPDPATFHEFTFNPNLTITDVQLKNVASYDFDPFDMYTTDGIVSISANHVGSVVSIVMSGLEVGEYAEYDIDITFNAPVSPGSYSINSNFSSNDGTTADVDYDIVVPSPPSSPVWSGNFARNDEKSYSGTIQYSLTGSVTDPDGNTTVTGDGGGGCNSSDFSVTYTPGSGIGQPVGVEVVADFTVADGITTKICTLTASQGGDDVNQDFTFTTQNAVPTTTVSPETLTYSSGGTEFVAFSIKDSIGAAFQPFDFTVSNLKGIDKLQYLGSDFTTGTFNYDVSGEFNLSLNVFYLSNFEGDSSFDYEIDDGDNTVTGTVSTLLPRSKRRDIFKGEIIGHLPSKSFDLSLSGTYTDDYLSSFTYIDEEACWQVARDKDGNVIEVDNKVEPEIEPPSLELHSSGGETVPEKDDKYGLQLGYQYAEGWSTSFDFSEFLDETETKSLATAGLASLRTMSIGLLWGDRSMLANAFRTFSIPKEPEPEIRMSDFYQLQWKEYSLKSGLGLWNRSVIEGVGLGSGYSTSLSPENKEVVKYANSWIGSATEYSDINYDFLNENNDLSSGDVTPVRPTSTTIQFTPEAYF